MSLASPSGEPESTQRTISAISASLSERSFENFWMPTVLSMDQGGIWRMLTRCLMERAQGRTCS